jgi:hypothetical protein
MGIARPVRALIGVAIVVWCFFLYVLFKPSPELHGPGDRYLNFERDPNLDRKLPRDANNYATLDRGRTRETNQTDKLVQRLGNQRGY